MQEVELLPRAKSNQCGHQVKLTILNWILLKTELIQICVESVSCFFFLFFLGGAPLCPRITFLFSLVIISV